MTLRPLLGAASTLLVAAAASAQTDVRSKLMPLPGPIQDGGVYDVASGTWSSDLSAQAASAQVLYDNTCAASSYLSLDAGERTVDTGRLPSTSSPSDFLSVTGTANDYDMMAVRLAYVTSEPTVDLSVNLFQCFNACSDASALVPDHTLSILGAPGSASGLPEAWSITVDLGNLAELPNMLADCDGVYDNVRAQDLFGWSFEQVTAPVTGPAGPLVAGDPFGLLGGGSGSGCGWGEGTSFDSGTEGTGVGTDDLFELDASGALLGCSFFGGYFAGNPYASLYLELAGGEPVPPSAGVKFCAGDGLGTPCPCGNDNDGSIAGGASGCANGSFAGGAALDASGSASLAAADLLLEVQGLAPGQPGLFFQGENAVNSGLGNAFGDGLRCAGGGVVRLGVRVSSAAGEAASNGIDVGVKGLVVAGDTKRYQFWYRDPAGSPCGNAFNLSNGYEIVWQP